MYFYFIKLNFIIIRDSCYIKSNQNLNGVLLLGHPIKSILEVKLFICLVRIDHRCLEKMQKRGHLMHLERAGPIRSGPF